MRVELFGLCFETPGVTAHLWSSWRASTLETRMFDLLKALSPTVYEKSDDEHRLHIDDAKVWKTAMNTISRVMKGWQEEASDNGGERRSWCWMVEGDVGASGYDHTGEPANLWAFLRLTLDLNRPGEAEKAEIVDLDNLGFCIWGLDRK